MSKDAPNDPSLCDPLHGRFDRGPAARPLRRAAVGHWDLDVLGSSQQIAQFRPDVLQLRPRSAALMPKMALLGRIWTRVFQCCIVSCGESLAALCGPPSASVPGACVNNEIGRHEGWLVRMKGHESTHAFDDAFLEHTTVPRHQGTSASRAPIRFGLCVRTHVQPLPPHHFCQTSTKSDPDQSDLDQPWSTSACVGPHWQPFYHMWSNVAFFGRILPNSANSG